MIMMMIIIFIF